jgi:hypothetical protein
VAADDREHIVVHGFGLGFFRPTTRRDWRAMGAYTAFLVVGVVIGPPLGKVAGVFVAFLIPFLDLDIIQSPMLHPEPQEWALFLPGYGVTQVLLDASVILAHGSKST